MKKCMDDYAREDLKEEVKKHGLDLRIEHMGCPSAGTGKDIYTVRKLDQIWGCWFKTYDIIIKIESHASVGMSDSHSSRIETRLYNKVYEELYNKIREDLVEKVRQ